MVKQGSWIIKRAGVVAVVVGLGFAMFVGIQALRAAVNPDEAPVLRTTRTPPAAPFEGTMNGIKFFPHPEKIPPGKCDVSEIALHQRVVGTVWEINATYLPAGVREVIAEPEAENWVPVAICDGEIVRTLRVYEPVGSPPVSVRIVKIGRTDTYYTPLDPKDMSSGSISGKPAVFVAPAPTPADYLNDPNAPKNTPPCVGLSLVIIKESFGLTVVEGAWMCIEETIRVAQGLR